MEKSVSEDERAWFIFRKGDESEDGDRVNFSRWGKRNVVSHHFTELVLEITEMEMLFTTSEDLPFRSFPSSWRESGLMDWVEMFSAFCDQVR